MTINPDSRSLICPLVGAFHRPPAKTVLENLPARAPLRLVPEPENPYDAGAIRVLVNFQHLRDIGMDMSELCEALDAAGADEREIIDGPPLQLGYCAATGGKPLAKIAALWSQSGLVPVGNVEVAAALDTSGTKFVTLIFGPDGQPGVKLTSVEIETSDE